MATVAASTGLNNMHILMTIPCRWPEGTGRCCSVSMKPLGDITVAVCVYDIAFQPFLYYSVGIVDKSSGKTNWSLGTRYDTGKHPSVSLISMNDELHVVEVHSSDYRKSCYYHTGRVNAEERTIEWGKSTFLGCGVKPKVSTNDNGAVVVVMEKSYSWSNKVHFYIGRANPQRQVVEWITASNPSSIPNFNGVEPDVSLNNDRVVAVCCSSGRSLQYRIGVVGEDLSVCWNDFNSPFCSQGKNPSIALNTHGNIVAVHQASWRQLSYCCGCLSSNGSILWGESKMQGHGEYPTISLTDDGYIYEMHKTHVGFQLFHFQGELRNQVSSLSNELPSTLNPAPTPTLPHPAAPTLPQPALIAAATAPDSAPPPAVSLSVPAQVRDDSGGAQIIFT